MPFPASMQTIEVRGGFEGYPDGTPATGTVKFTSNEWLFGPTDDVIIPPFDALATLDTDGTFSMELPATDDPQWNPQGWAYSVTMTINGKKKNATLELPYDGDLTVQLADVLQAGTVTPGESYILLAARGAPGGVASLDGTGKVPAMQLPSATAPAWTDVTGKPSFATVATTGDYVDLLNRPTIPSSPSQVGLGNVDNTSDANKPVSTAQQTALNLKANLASPTFTGTPTLPTGTIATTQTAGNNTTALATTAFVAALGALKANLASPALTGTPTAPTPATADSSTQVATTAFTQAVAALVQFTANAAYDASTAATLAAKGSISPTDHNLVGWTFDPALILGSIAMPTSGTAIMARIRAMGSTVSNILLHFTAATSGLTGGYCALYNDAGTLLSVNAVTNNQASLESNWSAGGLKTCPLIAPQAVTPGAWYRVLFWFTGTTGPTTSRALNSSTVILNVGFASAPYRYATANTGLTTTAPGTIGTQTGGPTAYWVGLS